MKPPCVLALPVVLALAACATLPPAKPDPAAPGPAAAVIAGAVKSVGGRPLPGLVLLERGELHGNVWDRGALVGPDGRFRIEVAAAGAYGVHVYASGYFYRPQAVTVRDGQTLALDIVLAPEPSRDRDPVIRSVRFFPAEAARGKVTVVALEVADPDDNLGPQVMAFNAATGRAHALEPPGPVRSLKASFPQGVYRLEVDTARAALDPGDWHFVVADHACYTSDILAFPHRPAPARVVDEARGRR